MSLLSPLAPSSAPLSSLPADLAGPSAGHSQDPAVRAVERAQGVHDPLRERARQTRYQQTRSRQDETGRSEERDQRPRGVSSRAIAPRRDSEAESRLPGSPAGDPWPGERGDAPRAPVSAPFLVQVFGQDLGRPQVFIAEHRDAATRGSEAYRRAGATPPVYSEEPAVFRVAV